MGRPKVCHMRFVSPDMLPAHVPRHHWRPSGGLQRATSRRSGQWTRTPPPASQATAPTPRTLRFIDPPEFSQVLQRWVWDGLEVRAVRFGSVLHGLFATRDIEPGLMIPYVGDMFTDDSSASEADARRSAHGLPPSRYILEEFDANPDAPACKQLYCVAGFANEAYADRLYNSTFVTFNGYEDADRTICKNMPSSNRPTEGVQADYA